METCSRSGVRQSQDGASTSQGWHVAGATSPKTYWHVISSSVIKALGSRKAKGTGEHRVGGKKSHKPSHFQIKGDGKRRSMHTPRFQFLAQARCLFAEECETVHRNSSKLILI